MEMSMESSLNARSIAEFVPASPAGGYERRPAARAASNQKVGIQPATQKVGIHVAVRRPGMHVR
jgi:hypothetical protein